MSSTRSKTKTQNLENLELRLNNLKKEEIKEELVRNNCSLKGHEPTLRSRLFRFHAKVLGLGEVGWDPKTDEVNTPEQQIKNAVSLYKKAEVCQKLSAAECKDTGTLPELRDRLVRYKLIEAGFSGIYWTRADVGNAEETSDEECYDTTPMKGKNQKNYSSGREKKKNKSKKFSRSKSLEEQRVTNVMEDDTECIEDRR